MRLLKSLFITLVMLAGMIIAAGLIFWAMNLFFSEFMQIALGVTAALFILIWIIVYLECDN